MPRELFSTLLSTFQIMKRLDADTSSLDTWVIPDLWKVPEARGRTLDFNGRSLEVPELYLS